MSGVSVNIVFFSSVMFWSVLLPPSSGNFIFTVTDQFLYNSVSTFAELASAKIKKQFFWNLKLFVWVRTFSTLRRTVVASGSGPISPRRPKYRSQDSRSIS